MSSQEIQPGDPKAVDGPDLASWAAQRGKVPVDEAVLLVLQIAEAVAEAHAQGSVLRELCPSQLVVTRGADGGVAAKISDPPTAEPTGDPRSNADRMASGVLGLTPYASPEMVRQSSVVDGRTDIWSLGVILYELLAGKPPFGGDDAELMLQIMQQRAASIAARRGDVPRQLDEVLGWAMAKDPLERFRDVHAFAHALRPFAPPEGHASIDRIARLARDAKRRRQEANEEARRQRTERNAVVSAAEPLAEAARPASTPARVSSRPAAPVATPEAAAQPAGPVAQPAAARPVMTIEDEQSVTRDHPLIAPVRAPPAQAPAPTPSSVPPRAVSKSGRPAPLFAGAAADIDMELHSAPVSEPSPPNDVVVPRAPRVPEIGAASTPARAATATAPTRAATPAAATRAVTPTAATRAATPTAPARAVTATAPTHAAKATAATRAPTATAPTPNRPVVASRANVGPSSHLPPLSPPPIAASKLLLISAAVVCALVPVLLALLLLGRRPAPVPPPSPDPAATQPTAAEPPLAPTAAPADVDAAAEPPVAAPPVAAPRKGTARPAETSPRKPAGDEPGTLVAVAVGGSCTFLVNGAVKGTGTTVKVSMKPGSYTVTCRPATGGAKSRTVAIPAGGTAMATFKLP
jgi:serine/threonine-protein kinase